MPEINALDRIITQDPYAILGAFITGVISFVFILSQVAIKAKRYFYSNGDHDPVKAKQYEKDSIEVNSRLTKLEENSYYPIQLYKDLKKDFEFGIENVQDDIVKLEKTTQKGFDDIKESLKPMSNLRDCLRDMRSAHVKIHPEDTIEPIQ